MKRTIITAVFALTTLSGVASFANGVDKKVVIDKSGTPVTSFLSGECVITKWKDDSGLCAAPQTAAKAPEPQKKIISTISSKKTKAYTVSDKRSYIVFFDYNKSSLSGASKDVLSDLYSASRGANKAEFELTGHADRSGSDSYNMALSKKRALSVKEKLVQFGIPANDISISWKGESEPLVKTNDGIKEPQNRRTEIKVFTQVSKTK